MKLCKGKNNVMLKDSDGDDDSQVPVPLLRHTFVCKRMVSYVDLYLSRLHILLYIYIFYFKLLSLNSDVPPLYKRALCQQSSRIMTSTQQLYNVRAGALLHRHAVHCYTSLLPRKEERRGKTSSKVRTEDRCKQRQSLTRQHLFV